jgi:hypothetical protein
MMNVATLYFHKWGRFRVWASKTRVVSLGHCETKKLRNRFWHIGGCVMQDFASYKFKGCLGLGAAHPR